MKYVSFLLLAFLLVSCKDNKAPQVHKISAEQILDVINDESVQIIDVRTETEFEAGNLKNAQNICITNDDFKAKAELLDKNKPVYLYCKSGVRSAKAAEVLREMGFIYIYDMKGGMDEWKEKGYKTDES